MQNITTALSMRANDLKYFDKIILYGYVTELIKKSNSPDFGIAKFVDYIEKLVDLYKTNDFIKIEKTIEEIRWKWLEERVGINYLKK